MNDNATEKILSFGINNPKAIFRALDKFRARAKAGKERRSLEYFLLEPGRIVTSDGHALAIYESESIELPEGKSFLLDLQESSLAALPATTVGLEISSKVFRIGLTVGGRVEDINFCPFPDYRQALDRYKTRESLHEGETAFTPGYILKVGQAFSLLSKAFDKEADISIFTPKRTQWEDEGAAPFLFHSKELRFKVLIMPCCKIG